MSTKDELLKQAEIIKNSTAKIKAAEAKAAAKISAKAKPAEPVAEPVIESVAEPVAEPVVEPVVDPVASDKQPDHLRSQLFIEKETARLKALKGG